MKRCPHCGTFSLERGADRCTRCFEYVGERITLAAGAAIACGSCDRPLCKAPRPIQLWHPVNVTCRWCGNTFNRIAADGRTRNV